MIQDSICYIMSFFYLKKKLRKAQFQEMPSPCHQASQYSLHLKSEGQGQSLIPEASQKENSQRNWTISGTTHMQSDRASWQYGKVGKQFCCLSKSLVCTTVILSLMKQHWFLSFYNSFILGYIYTYFSLYFHALKVNLLN